MAASAQAGCPCKNQPPEANNHPACFRRHVQGSTPPDAFNRAKILLSKLEVQNLNHSHLVDRNQNN
jgi:hypothetical protein